jgi:hypothetical protein
MMCCQSRNSPVAWACKNIHNFRLLYDRFRSETGSKPFRNRGGNVNPELDQRSGSVTYVNLRPNQRFGPSGSVPNLGSERDRGTTILTEEDPATETDAEVGTDEDAKVIPALPIWLPLNRIFPRPSRSRLSSLSTTSLSIHQYCHRHLDLRKTQISSSSSSKRMGWTCPRHHLMKTRIPHCSRFLEQSEKTSRIQHIQVKSCW